MIGDVINFGNAKWGEKYKAALNQTGRARSTLKNYAWVARNIPPNKRVAALSFTHHWEILRIGDNTKVKEVLKEVGAQAEKGHAPSTKELRYKVQKLAPRKVKKKSKPEPPPYEPSADEQSKLDAAEEALTEANDAIKSGGVVKILCKLDNKEKPPMVS